MNDITITQNGSRNTISFNCLNDEIDFNYYITDNISEFKTKFKTFDYLDIKNMDINMDFKLSDILEKFKISNICNNKANILLLFKPIAKDFGMQKKYLYLELEILKNNSKYIVKLSQLNYENIDILQDYEEIECEYAELYIDIIEPHILSIEFRFDIEFEKDLPKYLQHMSNAIMKDLLNAIKIILEKLK